MTDDLLTTVPPTAAESLADLLTGYEQLASYLDVLQMDRDAARKAVIPAAVQAELEAIDLEFVDRIEAGQEKLASMKKMLQTGCKLAGQTVNGSAYQVVYKKGSWGIKDITGLLAYAISHPEVMVYLEPPTPSAAVQVRRGGA